MNSTTDSSDKEIGLWPQIEPYQSDFLQVSDLHTIYYELCGKPTGRPVFVLHGGPGAGCSPYMRRFFDPDKFCIVLHDQRGAGKSTPPAEIKENNTQNLVEDIERLRKHLDLDKIILFGGSWGTTLALAYGQTYPEHTGGMILRGVFTATQEEIDHFYHGAIADYFPEVYEKFVNSLPEPDQRPLSEYLLSLIESEDPEQSAKYSKLWAWYEFKVAGLEMSDEDVNEKLDEVDSFAFARIENYYMTKKCFLEEGQLLKDAHKLEGIPIIIVNGRYDVICPPKNAYRLQKVCPDAKLVFAESAGHWMGEKPIERELLKAAKQFEQPG